MRLPVARAVLLFLASIILVAPALFAQATIDTVAGGGPDGIPALNAALTWPSGVTVHNGELYLTAWHRVLRVDAAGVIHPFAGVGGNRTYGGDGLPALNGNLYAPAGILFDDAGNLLIADWGNNRIRRVDAVTGIITTLTVAGVPLAGAPVGLAVDAAGNLYFAESANHRISRRDAITGVITNVAGTGTCGFGGNGGPGASALLCQPTHLALDRAAGDLYIADTQNNAVRKVNLPSGIISHVASVPRAVGLALDSAAGALYIGSASQSRIHRLLISTGVVTQLSPVVPVGEDPAGGLALDGIGGLYAADGGSRVRRLNLTNLQVTTVAGNGSTFESEDGFLARQTSFFFPGTLARDGSGNLYVSENGIRRIDSLTDIVSTLLAIPIGGGAPAPAPSGTLFGNPDDRLYIDTGESQLLQRDGSTGALSVAAGNGNYGFSGDGGPATAAEISFVNDGDVDAAGNAYFVDLDNFRVRRVDRLTGIITTVAGNGNEVYGGDGVPATSTGMSPGDVGLDGAGNLYITDYLAHRILRVDAATGIVSTRAGTGVPGYTGDGGPATSARLNDPAAIAVDDAGNISFRVSGERIRRIDATSGIINTIAGNGLCCFAGDGGPALDARFDAVGSLIDDGAGSLYMVDHFNFRIRKLSFSANGAPVAHAGADVQAECDSAAGAVVTLDGSGSTDSDSSAGTNDDIESFEWFENYGGAGQTLLGTGELLPATLSLGTHLITLRVTDEDGLSDTDEIEVTVADTTSPELEVSVTPEILSPSHNQFVPVHASVTAAVDACGSASTVLAQVLSSESEGDVEDSDIRNADFGTADFDFELRAKRSGGGSGRIYTVIYRSVDGSGNETLASDTVVVRHDKRSRTPTPTGGNQPKKSRQR